MNGNPTFVVCRTGLWGKCGSRSRAVGYSSRSRTVRRRCRSNSRLDRSPLGGVLRIDDGSLWQDWTERRHIAGGSSRVGTSVSVIISRRVLWPPRCHRVPTAIAGRSPAPIAPVVDGIAVGIRRNIGRCGAVVRRGTRVASGRRWQRRSHIGKASRRLISRIRNASRLPLVAGARRLASVRANPVSRHRDWRPGCAIRSRRCETSRSNTTPPTERCGRIRRNLAPAIPSARLISVGSGSAAVPSIPGRVSVVCSADSSQTTLQSSLHTLGTTRKQPVKQACSICIGWHRERSHNGTGD